MKIFLGPVSALTIKKFENFSRGNPTFFNDIFDGIFFLGYHSGEFCIFINANFEFISDSYLARFFRKGEFALLKPLKYTRWNYTLEISTFCRYYNFLRKSLICTLIFSFWKYPYFGKYPHLVKNRGFEIIFKLSTCYKISTFCQYYNFSTKPLICTLIFSFWKYPYFPKVSTFSQKSMFWNHFQTFHVIQNIHFLSY